MSVWSWLKLTVCLWLLRKAFKAAGWLLVFAVVIAAWPLTLVMAAGYVLAWRRGWPPVRLRRAAIWSLLMPPVWLALALRDGQPQAALLVPVRRLGARLAVPGRAGRGPRVPAVHPRHGPGRAGLGRRGVGMAELRHHHRAGRHHRLGADHLR